MSEIDSSFDAAFRPLADALASVVFFTLRIGDAEPEHLMSYAKREDSPGTGSPRDRVRSETDSTAIPRYRTTDLFGDCPWIVIEHRSEEYRLRVTRLGKLILTK